MWVDIIANSRNEIKNESIQRTESQKSVRCFYMRKIENMNVPGNESKGKFSEIKKRQFLLKKLLTFLNKCTKIKAVRTEKK